MFFEGSEKKFEIIIKDRDISLRSMPNDFWKSVVNQCQAEILSKISNEKCDAYLLSESSLFVWDDRVTMLTCGETTLVNSLEFILNNISKDVVDCVLFQRKNEYFSHLQRSNVIEDIEKLKKMIDGKALRFGKMDDHHTFLFQGHSESFTPNINDTTTELLMYHIATDVSEFLTKSNNTSEEIRHFLKIEQILPGYEIDDFVFEPFGYSLNAIKGSEYYTIHITPQEESSYISFETNAELENKRDDVLQKILDIIKPNAFDIFTFDENYIPKKFELYSQKNIVADKLSCGYKVTFSNFYKPNTSIQKPLELE